MTISIECLFFQQTIAAWRLIFNISAGIGAFGALAYCILFNGEEQSWNRIDHENDTNEPKES